VQSFTKEHWKNGKKGAVLFVCLLLVSIWKGLIKDLSGGLICGVRHTVRERWGLSAVVGLTMIIRGETR